jgi:RsiW-degrading membrane proteinase PrsW (M82 family)
MQRTIWFLHKLCIIVLLLLLTLAATYAYDIAVCFREFGFYSDDCHETTSFVLVYILPAWTIIAVFIALAFLYLSKKLRALRNRQG